MVVANVSQHNLKVLELELERQYFVILVLLALSLLSGRVDELKVILSIGVNLDFFAEQREIMVKQL